MFKLKACQAVTQEVMAKQSAIPGASPITTAMASSSVAFSTVTTTAPAIPMHTTEVVATAGRLTITITAAGIQGPSCVGTPRAIPEEEVQDAQTSPVGNINGLLNKKLKRLERNASIVIEDLEGL